MLPHRGRAREDHDRLLDRAQPARPPAIRSWCRSSIWWRSAAAAAASPGSTTSGSFTSGRSRPARVPGPAAYGRGGTDATTTDANLALGRINRDYFCGGELDADMDAVDDGARRDRRAPRRRPARGRARRDPDRQQQHDQRVEARLRQPRPRPARLHPGGVRRRRRDARGRARGRARHPQGRHPARRRRLLRVGHAHERPPSRLLRHAPASR